MIQKNNLQVLPFYDSIEKQHHKKPYSFGQVYPLIASIKSLLPFQLEVKSVANRGEEAIIKSASVIYLNTGTHFWSNTLEITEDFNTGLLVTNIVDSDKQLLTWTAPEILSLLEGPAYLRIIDLDGTEYYSEVFCLASDLPRYVKLDWWDNDAEGNPDFIHTAYIDTIVGKPKYEFDEEGTDRDGYFFAEKQLSKKVYRFGFVAPEYLCDALRIVRMSDNVQITFNGETYDCDSMVIEPEWEEQGDLASIEVEFTTGSVIKKIAAGYNWPQDLATTESFSSLYQALVTKVAELEDKIEQHLGL